MNNSTLHQVIISSFLDRQRPPTIHELASHFQCSEQTTRDGLKILGDYHGVVLHPHSDEVWVAHPFSATPTTCIVTSGGRRWWGNCAWCSLGAMQLAGGNATLMTRLGAIGDEVNITVKEGILLDKDYVLHFPVPMGSVWENVIYTCSVQLLFRNEDEVDEWCSTRGIPKGDVRPIDQIWHFAAEWYGRHADSDWRKWSLHDAVQIFLRHGLTGPTWALGGDAGRF
jgi:hypothetical protein